MSNQSKHLTQQEDDTNDFLQDHTSYCFTLRQNWLLENRVPDLVECLNSFENLQIEHNEILKIFIAADPNPNTSAVQWLIEAYCRKGFVYQDIKENKNSRVHSTLEQFNRYKKYFNIQDRNLYSYKTLSDLNDKIEAYCINKTESSTLLVNKSLQIKKLTQKQQIEKETCCLINRKNIQVVVPLTQFAAEWWGKGTQWCTSSTYNNQFESYNQYAPLFIICLRDYKNRPRKLQMFVHSKNFMFTDENDKDVSPDFVEINWECLKFIFDYAIEQNSNVFSSLDNSLKTAELCWNCCEKSGHNLKHVPLKYKTKELCKVAVQQSGLALKHVPVNLQTAELCALAFDQTTGAFEFIKPEFKTDQMNLKLIENLEIKLVPDNLLTAKICNDAIKKDKYNFEFVPPSILTFQMYLKATYYFYSHWYPNHNEYKFKLKMFEFFAMTLVISFDFFKAVSGYWIVKLIFKTVDKVLNWKSKKIKKSNVRSAENNSIKPDWNLDELKQRFEQR